MKPTEDSNFSADDDELVGRLVAAAGPRPELPRDLRERWETTFKAALAEARPSRAWPVGLGGVIAACVAFTLVLVAVWTPTEAFPVAETRLVRGHVEHLGDGGLAVGTHVRVGERVSTAPEASVAFAYRDADLRLGGDTVLEFRAATVRLVRGSIYVDSRAEVRAAGTPPVMVETAHGTLTHTGTQFLVTVDDTSLLAAVREGRIALSTDRFRRELVASEGSATEIRVSSDGAVAVAEVPRSGGIWAWVPAASPGPGADAASAADYLAWVARETGASVHYVDDSSRHRAGAASLHGDLSALSVEETLAAIRATTRLSVVEIDGQLIVSEGDEEPH